MAHSAPHEDDVYDLAVIGGGINGAGIARDAVGRGAKVILIERGDLAGATSSSSTKLAHGGLRYLENFEFRLVHESLKERDTILHIAKHITYPLRFVLPHQKHLRPFPILRIGLWLYDFLSFGSEIGRSSTNALGPTVYGQPLRGIYKRALSYSDGWMDDARLVVLNVMDAAERGATVLTRTGVTRLTPQDGQWQVTFQHHNNPRTHTIMAKTVVNAAGPWVHQVLEQSDLVAQKTPGLSLVRGSHLIVKKFYAGDHAYILQQEDGRIVFTIPYEKSFCVVGTTEVKHANPDAPPQISDKEKAYLLDSLSKSFKNPPAESDIVASYSGVRALVDDGNQLARKVTRDYVLHTDVIQGAPLISVFGGKLTTYRALAEKACNMLDKHLHFGCKSWTADVLLPGADIPGTISELVLRMGVDYPWLPDNLRQRYARLYGSRLLILLMHAHELKDLGDEIAPDLYAREIDYLMQHEYACTAEDILYRRTKLYLHMDASHIAAIESYMRKKEADL
jgi:glycerol-3-phosphate dehydrogenase